MAFVKEMLDTKSKLEELGHEVKMYLKKKIYLLNATPEITSKEEILAMCPVVINGNLELIKQ